MGSPPIVLSWYSKNWLRTNRSAMDVLPTFMFPSSTSLNWISFAIAGAASPARRPLASFLAGQLSAQPLGLASTGSSPATAAAWREKEVLRR